MTARVFKVENTLRKSIAFSQGLSIAEAVQAAEDNVIDLPPMTMADIDLLIDAMVDQIEGTEALAPQTVRLLYSYANDLIGAAKACGLDELSKAAFELCDLLEQVGSGGIDLAQAELKALVSKIRHLRQGGDALVEARVEELSRLRELRDSGVLRTHVESLFERVTQMAKDASGADFATVSVIADSKQLLKAKIGLDLPETPRELAFCNHTIQGDEVLWVEDATRDARFRDNPTVVDGPRIRFYAGAPITLQSGRRMGAVCVLGQRPRPWEEGLSARLQDLAGIVAFDIDRRVLQTRSGQASAKDQEVADTIAAYIRRAAAEIVMTDAEMTILHVSERWCAAYGRTPDQVVGRSVQQLDDAVADLWRPAYQRALAGEKQEGETTDWPLRRGRAVHWEAAPWRTGGKVAGLLLMSLPEATPA